MWLVDCCSWGSALPAIVLLLPVDSRPRELFLLLLVCVSQESCPGSSCLVRLPLLLLYLTSHSQVWSCPLGPDVHITLVTSFWTKDYSRAKQHKYIATAWQDSLRMIEAATGCVQHIVASNHPDSHKAGIMIHTRQHATSRSTFTSVHVCAGHWYYSYAPFLRLFSEWPTQKHLFHYNSTVSSLGLLPRLSSVGSCRAL